MGRGGSGILRHNNSIGGTADEKADPRHTPRNWYEFKEILATFDALLWVLFGDLPPLYDQVLTLWRVLNHPSIKVAK